MSNNEYNNEHNPIQPQEPEWKRVAKQVLILLKGNLKYIAMDKNRDWCAYIEKPKIYGDIWDTIGVYSRELSMLSIPTCPDWTQSLISREE